MTIEFTKHPALEAPTDEEIVILGEADPKLRYESNIRSGCSFEGKDDECNGNT